MGMHYSDTWNYINQISIVVILEDNTYQRVTFPLVHKTNYHSVYHKWRLPAAQFYLKDKLMVNTNYANMVDFLKISRNANMEIYEAYNMLTFILSPYQINKVYGSIYEINHKFYQIDYISIMEMNKDEVV